MAIAISGTLEPAGKFPLVEAPSIALPTGERLDALFDDDGKIKSDSLPPVETADARLDELLDDDGNVLKEKLPADLEASDPRVDELMENVNAMFSEDGKLKEEFLPDIGATDPRVDDLLVMAENMFDENGKIAEELLPDGIGGDSGGVTDTRLNDLLDDKGIVKTANLPVTAILQTVMNTVLDDDQKIQESFLPEDWVKGYVEEYINEALGGEY